VLTRCKVGSTDIPVKELSQDPDDIISDLRDLCDLLARHNKRLAYENWCWSTHAPTWKDVWHIVEKVDRPNIGLCLDTFQTAGFEWGDPTTSSGRVKDASIEEQNRQFSESMNSLASTVPKEKIYLLQISDAKKPEVPIENKRLDELWPRARWSHDYRPMPYDGGYLPVEEVAKAVLRTGFRGWLSMEIFEGSPNGKATGDKTKGMKEYARRAMQSMERLLQSCEDVE
jgi:sugar phosphate isomerase/epimerase